MAETVLRVEHVGMRFNLSKERVDSLKDYIFKIYYQTDEI